MRKLYVICRDFSRQLRNKNISSFAASTAFFLFLSLIPMLMLLCAIIPYTPIKEADLMSLITDLVPTSMDSLFINIIVDVYDKSIGVISVTAVATLWSAGKGIMALMRGLNAIHEVEEKRNYFTLRLVACFYTVMVLLVLIFSLLLMVFGGFILEIINSRLPQAMFLVDLFMEVRVMLLWVVITIAIALIYTYIPKSKLGFGKQLPGAIVASVGWSVITFGFSVYIDRFKGFTMYGNLTTIIVLMLWLYACMYMIMAGALLNRYLTPAYRYLETKKKCGA